MRTIIVLALVACGGNAARSPSPVPPPVTSDDEDTVRELTADYEVVVAGTPVGIQHLYIDKRPDGERVFTAKQTGTFELALRVEAGDGHGSLLRRESPHGVLEAYREGTRLHVTVTPRTGVPVRAVGEIPETTYLTGFTLAPDQLVYPELQSLEVGASSTVAVADISTDGQLAVVHGTATFARTPDEQRTRHATMVPVRMFTVEISVGPVNTRGTLAMDADGYAVEQTFGDEVIRRVD